MQVALNGIDYTDQTDKWMFTFIGDASYFVYLPFFLGFFLVALLLIALMLLWFLWV